MAFLIPAILPALEALGLGALSGLGAVAAKKVVGDAMPEETVGKVLSLGLQNPEDPLISSMLTPNQKSLLPGLKASMEASPTLWFTPEALSFQRGTGMQVQPQVTNLQNQLLHSQTAQTLSDAAALQQFPQVQQNLQQSNQMRMNPHYATSAWDVRSQNPGLPLRQDVGQAVPGYSPILQGSAAQFYQQERGQPSQAHGLTHIPMLPQATPTGPISQLSTQSQTGLAIAPQPHNKLMNNQAYLIDKPSAVGGMNPQAPGSSAGNSIPGVLNTASAVGNTLLNDVKNAASEAASGAIQGVGGVASNIAASGIKKAGSWFGNLVSGGLTTLARKVIGDAPPGDLKVVGDSPPYISNTQKMLGYVPPTVRQVVQGIGDSDPLAGFGGLPGIVSSVAAKVVGDAPPGGEQGEVMTDDQQNAAVMNLQESVIFNLMSRLVLNEQVLVQSSSMPRGLKEAELNNYFARDLEALVGTYRQSEIQALFGFKGMTVSSEYSVLVTMDAVTKEVSVVFDSIGYLYASGVALETAKVSPPISSNETLTRLAPLLAGAALGEYSSQLRIKTFSTDVDLMMRATASTINNIQAQTGYSFCLPLVKCLGYLLARVTLMGDEFNQLVPDLYWTLQLDEEWTRAGRGFPLSPRGDEDVYNDYSWAGAKLAVISDATFVKAVTGLISTSGWDELHPSFWGTECAVVFIPQNDSANGKMNAVRMAMQMGYPIELQRAVGVWKWYHRGDTMSTVKPASHYIYKNSSLVYIRGPHKAVLFVILNSRENAGVGLALGDGVDQTEAHSMTLDAVDNPPNNPYVVGEGNTAAGRALRVVTEKECINMLLAYINEWEYTFGNASDRSSALRFWADHAYRWQRSRYVRNEWDVGSAQTLGLAIAHDKTKTGNMSAFTQFSDIPLLWENACRVLTKDRWGLIQQTARTTTLLPLAKVSVPEEVTKNFAWVNGSPADASRLPYEDYMINYLVLRRWVTCNEEYPEVRLDDPARIAHTICVMANIMATAGDLSAQQSDFSFSELFCSPLVFSASPASQYRCKQILFPSLEQLLTNGIQYPQYWNNRDVNLHCYESRAYWEVAYEEIYPPRVVDASTMCSLARIPGSISGQWFKPLYPQYIHLRLNLREMYPQRVQIRADIARLVYQCFISEEQTGLRGRSLAPISWLAWRLSLGVSVTGNSQNNGFKMQVANNMTIREYYMNFEQYDASRNQVLIREYSKGNVTVPPTSAAALPTGEFLIKRSIVDALQPVSIVMQGPRDAFIGVGIGSTAYQMFVQTNSPQALFVTQSWATVPDWVFAGRGLMSEQDTI